MSRYILLQLCKFYGSCSVIGSMGSVDDEVSRQIVSTFSRQPGSSPWFREISCTRAIAQAVQQVVCVDIVMRLPGANCEYYWALYFIVFILNHCRRCPPNSSTAHISEDKAHPEAASTVVKALDTEADLELLNSYTPESSIFGGYHGWFSKQVVEWPTFANMELEVKGRFSACKQQNDEIQFSNKRSTLHRNGTIVVFPRSSRQCPPAHRQILAPCLGDSVCTQMHCLRPHSQTHNQIIAIDIDISGSPLATEPPSFTFYVKRNTHLELESTYTSRYGKASEGSSSALVQLGPKSHPILLGELARSLQTLRLWLPDRIFSRRPKAAAWAATTVHSRLQPSSSGRLQSGEQN
ncbi:hypothetical protein DEU56DRAFT_753635 [Suillus clintonianus]|uniref:uncharacterized protein n=1 Tax=Suillus clintonianus TaxID=1904413 RepID=UPI001B86A6CC|nr:uncharacterized protein DEU56DRAFT_753635 [Suillus clintonianus]KAG2146762.1 hypothetical protein DEU56DRAFT_753635 [Suillus clintonianus]